MADEREDCRHSLHIRLVMVSNDCLRHDLHARYGLAKECFRTGPIPFVAQEHIDHLPVLIDCAIQVEFQRATKTADFVDSPFLSHPPSTRTERGG
jgi:hypothetical protein